MCVISLQPLNYAWFVHHRYVRGELGRYLLLWSLQKMHDRNDFRQWWNEPFAILSSKLIRIQSKDLVMTCGPVFFYWYYNRYQAKGLWPNASTRLVWKFFKKSTPTQVPVRVWKKGPKKKTHIRTSWVCSKVDTHQTLVCDGNCLILIVEREHFSSHQKTHISTSWVCSKADTSWTLVVTENVWVLL